MRREDIEKAANYFVEMLSDRPYADDVARFAVKQWNAALEEGSKALLENCIEKPQGKPCVFCRDQADTLRALKISE